MSDNYDFDVAIIRAGLAVSAAALTLALKGIETVVVERGISWCKKRFRWSNLRSYIK
ncbi:MAG: hypothetical protein ACTSYD_14140 [Candidatus Heimdallarchaeaceae archaeon]